MGDTDGVSALKISDAPIGRIGQATTARAAVPNPGERDPKTRRWPGVIRRLFILGLAAALLVAFVVNWDRWVGAATVQTTDDAYLQSDLTPLSAKVPGYLRQIHVADYQRVKAGDVLFQIEQDDYLAAVDQAEANVAAAQAALDYNQTQKAVQRSNIEAAEASIGAASADVTRYVLEARRQRDLLSSGITGTHQLVEQGDANEQKSRAAYVQSLAQREAQRQQLAVLDAQTKQLEAALAAQRALLETARINLGYTSITSPIDGVVGLRQVQLGQYLGVGAQVVSVLPLPNIWVLANYKETQMTNVRTGQPVDIAVDAFPDARITGRVQSWAPASGSQFALLPPDNATGNFTKVVQRITVKITIDSDGPVRDLLRPGMSVITRVHTDRQAAPLPSAGEGH